LEIYETEEQRVEAVKKWWNENWRSLAGGVILGLAIVFGWRAWVGYEVSVGEQASMQFEQLLGALQGNNVEAVSQQADLLRREFGSSAYAVFAALAEARAAVDQGKLADARASLEWALANTGDSGLRHVARLRLARVALDQGDRSIVAGLLAEKSRGAFAGEYAHLEGDLAVAENRPDAARTAYRQALELRASNAQWIQMKLDDLGAETVTD